MPQRILHDEKEWFDKSTRSLTKFLPLKDKRILIRATIIIIILTILFIRFHKLSITLFAIALISYIRFKRIKYQIDIEIEPSYLLAIAITLAFGIDYGIAFIIIPAFMTILNGVSIGLAVNIINKIVVIIATYLYWTLFQNGPLMIAFATSLVLITDILGFFIRRRFGQPLHQIVQVLATNTIIRYCYFSLFLDLVIYLIN